MSDRPVLPAVQKAHKPECRHHKRVTVPTVALGKPLDSAIHCPTHHAEACYAVGNFLDRDPPDIFHILAERGFAVKLQCPAEWPLSTPHCPESQTRGGEIQE